MPSVFEQLEYIKLFLNEIQRGGYTPEPTPEELKRIEGEVDRNIRASHRAAGASREDFEKHAKMLAKKAEEMPPGRRKRLHSKGALGHAVEAAQGKWRKTGVQYTKDPLLNRPGPTKGEPFIMHKRHPRGIKALESTSLAEQLEEIKYFLEGKMTMGDLFKSQPGDDPDPAQGQRDIHHTSKRRGSEKPMSKEEHKKTPIDLRVLLKRHFYKHAPPDVLEPDIEAAPKAGTTSYKMPPFPYKRFGKRRTDDV